MFRHKKNPHRLPMLTLTDESGMVIYSGRLIDMTFCEELVIALSIEFFDDPTPCEIHRSAVLSRIFLSIEDALAGGQSPVIIASLDEDTRRLFSAYPNATRAALLL